MKNARRRFNFLSLSLSPYASLIARVALVFKWINFNSTSTIIL